MNTFIEDILTRIQDLLELTPPVSINMWIMQETAVWWSSYFYCRSPQMSVISSSALSTDDVVSSRKTASRLCWPVMISCSCLRRLASWLWMERVPLRGNRRWWGVCWRRWWTPSACCSPNCRRRRRKKGRPPSLTVWVMLLVSLGEDDDDDPDWGFQFQTGPSHSRRDTELSSEEEDFYLETTSAHVITSYLFFLSTT